MNIIQKPITFLKEVKQELSKVSWSTREELMGSTVVVIVVTFIMAAYIGIIDFGLSRIIKAVFKWAHNLRKSAEGGRRKLYGRIYPPATYIGVD